jgi:hypothetical protein
VSRRLDRPVSVACRADGSPTSFVWEGDRLAIRGALNHFREWVGALDGAPERDIWRVETARGVCELHHMHPPADAEEAIVTAATAGDWVLHRWED